MNYNYTIHDEAKNFKTLNSEEKILQFQTMKWNFRQFSVKCNRRTDMTGFMIKTQQAKI
jgi:glutathione peroxidase-family protein